MTIKRWWEYVEMIEISLFLVGLYLFACFIGLSGVIK
jgi:hypothetical protein